MPIRRVPVVYSQNGGGGDLVRSVKNPDGTQGLLKATYTDEDVQRLMANPDAPYDSAWDSLDWKPAGTTTDEHELLARTHQDTTDLYWNGQPDKPETGVGYYLRGLNPAQQSQYKSWFSAGSHMPKGWLTNGL